MLRDGQHPNLDPASLASVPEAAIQRLGELGGTGLDAFNDLMAVRADDRRLLLRANLGEQRQVRYIDDPEKTTHGFNVAGHAVDGVIAVHTDRRAP